MGETLQKQTLVRNENELVNQLRKDGLSRDEARAKAHQLVTEAAAELSPERPAADGPQTMIAKAFRAEREKEELRQAYVAELAEKAAEEEAITQGKFRFQCADMRAVFVDRSKWHEPYQIADAFVVAELKKDFIATFNAALEGRKSADELQGALIGFKWRGGSIYEEWIANYLKAFGPQKKALEASDGT